MSRDKTNDMDWWRTCVVYQVLTETFKDSNDDGVGDIRGICSKLDYVQSLGADVIWLCPMYEGPQVDLGYDITNYRKVYSKYGETSDLEDLIQQCHERKMRVMLDLVISHTSSQHPWFLDSRSSKDSAKRDWYIWRPARQDDDGNRRPPNNWKSVFGKGSAWEWDDETGEYYLHMFTPEQPDLNWENDEARAAIIEEATTFWLEKGVDAFRIDAANMYSKPEGLPDADVLDEDAEFQSATELVCNGPRIHEYLKEVADALARHGAISAGEIPFTAGRDDVLRYVSGEGKQLDMAFQFEAVGVGMGLPGKYDVTPRNFELPAFKKALEQIQDIMRGGTDAWTAVFLESHDQGRSISRFGNDAPEHRVASGRMLALLLATLSGTLYIYQGQEIGLVNVPADYPVEKMEDMESGSFWDYAKKKYAGDDEKLDRAASAVRYLSRYNARMPMPWDQNGPHFGFSSADSKTEPHPLSGEINVASQEGDPSSVLSFWRQMVKLRKEKAELFVFGDFVPLHEDHGSLFIYLKVNNDKKSLTILNFGTDEDREWKVNLDGEIDLSSCELLISTLGDEGFDDDVLRPLEGRVYYTK